MAKDYKHLTFNDRLQIEVLLKAKHKPGEVAEIMGVHYTTIYREIKRGQYVHRNTDWTEEVRYSPEQAHEKHLAACKGKGPSLKIGNDSAFVRHVEHKIINGKYSPEAVLAEINRDNLQFDTKICVSTLYNYIRQGLFLNLTLAYLPYRSHTKHCKKRVQKRVSRGESIEKRPEHIDAREEFGHWEMDTVVGPRGRSKKAYLVFTERKTRYEIIELLKRNTMEEVVRALDRIERSMTEKQFRRIFKTITVDNGAEFSDVEGMERSRRNKKKRTKVYYCHPYCSCERGSNENQNRFIRRHVPKGINFDDMPRIKAKYIEEWMNQYPRGMFKYQTAQEKFQEELWRFAV